MQLDTTPKFDKQAVTVVLTREQYLTLAVVADQDSRSMSYLIRDAIAKTYPTTEDIREVIAKTYKEAGE